MERARSDKNKNKPSGNKEKMRADPSAGQSGEGASMNMEPTGGTLSRSSTQRNSLPPAASPTKRQERQRRKEPSVDLRESEKFSEPTLSTITANGHQGIEDNSSTHRRIAERAYILFQENGCEHGNDWSDWFEAERQIKETRM